MEELGHEEELQRPEAPPDLVESAWSGAAYSLRFAGWPNLRQLVAIAVATAIYTVLSWLSSTLLNSGVPVVSWLFVAIGFGIPFAMWFGGWAFVVAYIGNFIGAGVLTGMPLLQALPFGATDLIQLGLPMLFYRLLAPRFGVDPLGKDVLTLRGFLFFLICGAVIPNVLGGLYGNFVLVSIGFVPTNLFFAQWAIWSISNIVLTLIIGSILLTSLGSVMERFGLTIRNALN
ncbi:MAG: hypothetical protein J2P37_21190 [Ktedonobacteraceae bacterium]|nr:hypothetical protein [Ktedonobacteraceae bacterium]MBO0790996.1 hypothetical protein [Ktedonobacteraceae bacterium]